GRRYLASSGWGGWTLPPGVLQRSVVSLAHREHLRLVELRGVREDEARGLLAAPHPTTGAEPPEAVVRAVLGRSPELGGEGHAPQPGRHNPFLVAHYRGWWEDEPGLRPEEIADAGPDAYVEGRIVARLRDRDIEEILPAVILLGRFDEAMLAAALAAEPGAPRVVQIAELLADQEWIDASVDADNGLRVLSVSDGLLPMLRAWADRPEQRPRLAAARARLTAPLRD